eukprot:gnl/TRDRNA2_/TRDRNA2_188100_c0_seq1.p1 gnl/TRDRNA2_/TRDRNA2_188100_c0~~gnl/TRDRNA2_/TRDRNA2_188100_c0_seq1.p1  ORF type:complete len:271 (-),score=41.90 gnl/TRDRNA2_/TRDRNA2_188100_c0_seq1:206-1018(-)
MPPQASGTGAAAGASGQARKPVRSAGSGPATPQATPRGTQSTPRGSGSTPRGTSPSGVPLPGAGKGRGMVRSHKVVFLGEQGTGKTSVIRQFMYRSFDQVYQATVGIDFVSKMLCPEGRSQAVRLQLWDTAGQERFRALIPGYLRDSSACIVVYDITSRASFDSVRSWVDQVLQDRGREEVVLVLVGNKVDLEAERVVQKEEGSALAEELKMLFFEASARTAQGVDEIFNGVALALPSDTRSNKYEPDDEIVLEPHPELKEKQSREKCQC